YIQREGKYARDMDEVLHAESGHMPEFVERPADYHAGGGENPHCHLMISERINDGIERPAAQWFKRYNGKTPEKGGAQKTEALKPKAWLEQTREAWADHANRALERAGHDAR
ncbi:MobA/MobL family protein, partial [Escherichia coli]|uniref:MobA/MobL family protein n=1 Tax=Escherichia coli TaxID=562 RepID=UPI0015EEACAD